MWESNVPSNKQEPSGLLQDHETTLMSVGMMDSVYAPFTMCKSTVNFESSSSVTNSETDSDSDAVFYSVHEKNKGIKRILPVYQTDYSSRHHSMLPEHTWLTQFMDMFDVVVS
jgi:hypothetical protein